MIRGLTVLVTDDEPMIVTMLAEMLRSAGHPVIEAVGAQEAVRVLQKRHVDAIVTDRDLLGVTGLLAAVKRPVPERRAAVVFLSSYADRENPAPNVLQKPFQMKELQRKVADALAGRCG